MLWVDYDLVDLITLELLLPDFEIVISVDVAVADLYVPHTNVPS